MRNRRGVFGKYVAKKSFYWVSSLALTIAVANHALARDMVVKPYTHYTNRIVEPGKTEWHCWVRGDRILCLLANYGSVSAYKDGDRGFPELAGRIFNETGSFYGEVVSIPIHTVPLDMEMTGELAYNVMCKGVPSCDVVFGENSHDLVANIGQFSQFRNSTLADERILIGQQ